MKHLAQPHTKEISNKHPPRPSRLRSPPAPFTCGPTPSPPPLRRLFPAPAHPKNIWKARHGNLADSYF